MNKLVSLLTPGWNGKKFVHRLLNSILEQTYRPLEYIYVDDGSTDGTADIVLSYKSKFNKANIDFKFIQRENGGICEALMTGFQHVTGEYMSCPEYDDILLPYSVEEKVKYLEEHPDCAVVVAEAWVVNENNLEERKKLISNKNPNRFDRNHFHQCLTSNTIFNAACYMVRMSMFDKTHSNRTITPYKYGPNQQILLPLYYHYNRGFIETPLSLFVVRSNSLSHTSISYQQEISRSKEYHDLRHKILDSISMTSSDLLLYKKIVDIKYNRHILDIAIEYNLKDIFFCAYDELNKLNEISEYDKVLFLIMNNKIHNIIFRNLKKLSLHKMYIYYLLKHYSIISLI